MFRVQTRGGDTQKPAVSNTPRLNRTRIRNYATASDRKRRTTAPARDHVPEQGNIAQPLFSHS